MWRQVSIFIGRCRGAFSLSADATCHLKVIDVSLRSWDLYINRPFHRWLYQLRTRRQVKSAHSVSQSKRCILRVYILHILRIYVFVLISSALSGVKTVSVRDARWCDTVPILKYIMCQSLASLSVFRYIRYTVSIYRVTGTQQMYTSISVEQPTNYCYNCSRRDMACVPL